MIRRALASVVVAASLAAPAITRADDTPADDSGALFTRGVGALKSGRPEEAVAAFEALADRGVVDANASMNRGLAYGLRVRAGAVQRGDLGRAAQGFEEARSLATDAETDRAATDALLAVRAEVARRRARAGEPAAVDPGVPLFRSVVLATPEDTWAAIALGASIVLGAGLFVRGLSASRRGRIGGAIASAVALPTSIACAVCALAARDDRLHRQEGVIVVQNARPADEDHRPLAQAQPLPEAAKVDLLETRAGWAHVRWAQVDGWIPRSSVRPIAKAD
jgi:hypothetical protein